ncbi:uncharacterized protein EDB91DRAFT_1252071 [Suillus paluster]|uniref:uncharacterized protein n=1 Tax=Suillus paluster TaxID=48578 RepID=UPI001B87BECE|nr:uncharacterized protein EDB91DRAFT_1252071 [Suillus paluster]KAG1731636.1 hypothetical protein EDB91DRAFT_1252071 [Suillus paluster]
MATFGEDIDEIFCICPRFRILVIGKTGVGKSASINRAFGMEKALASHHKPGEANIDTEFISRQNERFVLHDSQGFEPGYEDDVAIAGVYWRPAWRKFLTLKREGKLGNIPVVAVFTKYDMLIDRMDRTLDKSSLEGLSKGAIKELVEKKSADHLQDVCIRPLQKFAGPDIPHAVTSAKRNYKETLLRLIQITQDCVSQHIALEVSVMVSIAQRVDTRFKIKESINAGKRSLSRFGGFTGYWKALVPSTAFKNRRTWDCLHVLHTNIVAVWDFHDPHHYLRSIEFKILMVNLVDRLEVRNTADPNWETNLIGLSTNASIMSTLAGRVAPIMLPSQLSRVVLQRFIPYIFNLTLVLQTLLLVSESQELSRRAIKLAVKSHYDSPMSREIHATLLERADCDTLDEIIEPIHLCSFDAETISRLRADIPPMGSCPDELWEDGPQAQSLPNTSTSDPLKNLTNELQERPQYPIASGGYGDIWKCVLVKPGETVQVAVKTIRASEADNRDEDLMRKNTKCTANQVVHGDLTGSNVLVYGNGRACLADFGLSTIILEFKGTSYFTTNVWGNIRWAAAELYEAPDDNSLTQHRVRYILFWQYHLAGIDLQVMAQVVKGKKPEPPEESQIAPGYWDFIQRCWLPPASRPLVEEIVAFIGCERQALSS